MGLQCATATSTSATCANTFLQIQSQRSLAKAAMWEEMVADVNSIAHAPAPDKDLAEEAALVVEEATQEETPVVEEASAGETVPAADGAAQEEAPATAGLPAADEAAGNEEVPVAEEHHTTEWAPSAETDPAAQESVPPFAQEAVPPFAEEAVAEAEAPAEGQQFADAGDDVNATIDGVAQNGTHSLAETRDNEGVHSDGANLYLFGSKTFPAPEKGLDVDCKQNVPLTLYSDYWRSQNGNGYLSRDRTAPGPDVGEKWMFKDLGDGSWSLFCPYWKQHNGRGYLSRDTTVPSLDVGERWELRGESRGRVALYCPYWNSHNGHPWRSAHGTVRHNDVGEKWLIRDTANRQACTSKKPHGIKGKWVAKGTVYEHVTHCVSTGVQMELTESQLHEFASEVTKTLERSSAATFGVAFEGVSMGASHTATQTISTTWKQQFQYTYSQKKTTSKSEQLCVSAKGTNLKYVYEWQWVLEVQYGFKKVEVATKAYALTRGIYQRPRCLPGGQLDRYYYQECAPGHSLDPI